MEKDWKLVYYKGEDYKAVIAKELLEENGFRSVVLNRKDSTYQTFGDIELYVSGEDEQKSELILKQLKTGEH
jgi:hypothetical protein